MNEKFYSVNGLVGLDGRGLARESEDGGPIAFGETIRRTGSAPGMALLRERCFGCGVKHLNGELGVNAAKLIRACGGCLGAKRR